MNKIFEKNVNALKNEDLKNKIINMDISLDLEITADNNIYNLKYKGEYLHYEQSPLGEAKQIFEQSRNTKDSIHVIYGIGLGYLFQYATQNSKGRVILYEPQLDILYYSFNFVDFSKELEMLNVFIFSDISKVASFFSYVATPYSDASLISLPSYRNIFEENFKKDSKELELMFGSILVDFNYKKEKLFDATLNVYENIPMLLNETPMNLYKGIYKGQTAVITSAGPTLSDNIETLKKYRNNIYIFCVGPALKVLQKNGITPDFLCIIESMDCIKQVEGLDLSDITLISEPYTYKTIHNLKTKNKILHNSSNMAVNDIWAKISGLSNREYSARGTVSFCALDSAINMGFDTIALVGQDLAYVDNQCYAKDSSYGEIVCELNPETNKFEVKAKDFEKFVNALSSADDYKWREKRAKERLNDLNASLHSITRVSGEMIPTTADYAAFIPHFTEYAKKITGKNLINTSMKGAEIEGFKDIPLNEVLKNSTKRKEFENKSDFEYDLQKAKDILKNIHNLLKEAYNKAEENNKSMGRASMDFKRNREVNKDVLMKIRNAINLFVQLTDYTRTTEHEVFSLFTMREELEIKDSLRKIETYDLETTPKAIAALKKYYSGVLEKLNLAFPVIEKSIKFVEEKI